MSDELTLIDASAFWRLASPDLDPARRAELADRVAHGHIAACTALLLETRAGQRPPAADPADLPLLRVSERAEQRAAAAQLQMRTAHQHLGIPPMDYLIAAIAEAHRAVLLHYDADFTRMIAHTDLAVREELLAPLGTLR